MSVTEQEHRHDIGLPLTGRTVLDQVLLAIIDANTKPTLGKIRKAKDREVRLARIKASLFGTKEARGPHEYDDQRALMHMAMEYSKDRSLVALGRITRMRSVRALAAEATTLTTGSSDAAIADRLRSAFASQRDRLVCLLTFHDFIPESQEREAAKEVLAILGRHGVITNREHTSHESTSAANALRIEKPKKVGRKR